MAQAAIKLIKSEDDGRYRPHVVVVDSAEFDQKSALASAYLGIEGPISDLLLMGEIAADLVDKLFNSTVERATPFDYFIPERERQHAQFAVRHLLGMINAQKTAFDRAVVSDG